jgi:hypothetical protein
MMEKFMIGMIFGEDIAASARERSEVCAELLNFTRLGKAETSSVRLCVDYRRTPRPSFITQLRTWGTRLGTLLFV